MMPRIDFQRLATFKYAIINLIGQNGYPWSLPTEFQITHQKNILLKKPASPVPFTGKHVGILFSHITAIPTGGYTDRRYMLIRGSLNEQDGKLKLHPEAISEWDEKMLPFPELCARAVPQGQRYLQSLQRQPEG